MAGWTCVLHGMAYTRTRVSICTVEHFIFSFTEGRAIELLNDGVWKEGLCVALFCVDML